MKEQLIKNTFAMLLPKCTIHVTDFLHSFFIELYDYDLWNFDPLNLCKSLFTVWGGVKNKANVSVENVGN